MDGRISFIKVDCFIRHIFFIFDSKQSMYVHIKRSFKNIKIVLLITSMLEYVFFTTININDLYQ